MVIATTQARVDRVDCSVPETAGVTDVRLPTLLSAHRCCLVCLSSFGLPGFDGLDPCGPTTGNVSLHRHSSNR